MWALKVELALAHIQKVPCSGLSLAAADVLRVNTASAEQLPSAVFAMTDYQLS